MDRSGLAIVIPALNESATIGDVVCQAGKYGTPVVIDDGSTDQTALISEQNGAMVVSHSRNRGYDASLNTGFKTASKLGYEIIVTMDADGQHDPRLIPEAARLIKEGNHVVVGIRKTPQRISEFIFSMYTRTRYGIRDPLCGFKAYRSDLYEEFGCFDSYGSVGTELTLNAAAKGYDIGQIQIPIKQREDSSPRFGSSLKANFKILRAMLIFEYRRHCKRRPPEKRPQGPD